MVGIILAAIGAVVIGCELVLLGMGTLELLRGANASADELVRRQAADIRARAMVGQTPEWHQYDQGLADALAGREDSLRVFSSMALTVGVAGTMSSMAVVLIFAPGDANLFDVVLRHVGSALVVSSLGVGCHIVLAFMSRAAHGRARKHHRRCISDLRQIAEETQPTLATEERLRVEDQRTKVLQEGLVEAVRTSLATLPEALKKLEERIGSIGAMLERQDAALLKTTDALAGSTAKIETSTGQLGAMSDRIAAAGVAVAEVPARMAAEVDRLGASVGTVSAGLQALPTAFEAEFTRSLREWGEAQRGQNAAIQTAYQDAAKAVGAASVGLGEEVRQLTGRWQTTAENSLRNVMDDVRNGLVTTILAGIRDPMVQVGNEFASAGAQAKQIRETLTHTSTAVAAWQATIDALLRQAAGVAERTGGAQDERTLQALKDLRDAIRTLADAQSDRTTHVVRAAPDDGASHLTSVDHRLAMLVERAAQPWPERLVGDVGTWWRGPTR